MAGASLSISAIEARADAATRGPWQVVEDCFEPSEKFGALAGKVAQRRIFTVWDHPQLHGPTGVVNGAFTLAKVEGQQPTHIVRLSAEDAEFIAHAREDIPVLIAEVKRLRALVRRNSIGARA